MHLDSHSSHTFTLVGGTVGTVETMGAHSEAVDTVVVGHDGLLFTGSNDNTVTTTR
jgi:hypothetical protein